MKSPHEQSTGLAGRIARAFIDSKLTPLIVLTSILLGIGAVLLLPREEEPQIKVPMIDVMVRMPGASAKEVEERATRPMEQLLWEIPGVEYVYSISRPGESLVIVRFKVGEDLERSLVKLNHKLQSNFDRIPPGVSHPLIKAHSIDDVPILALTFHSRRYDHLTLRRVAKQVEEAIKQVPLVADTQLIGGARRQVRVLLDPAKLAAHHLSIAALAPILQQANRQNIAGGLTRTNREVRIETGGFLKSADEVGRVVIGVFQGRPVYLNEVAEVVDGAEEPSQYVFFGRGAAVAPRADEEPAVTLSIAKRPGANAIEVAGQVLRQVEALRGYILPEDVEVTVTRHYGRTAEEKSDELLLHMGIAIVSVSLLIWLTLGARESLIVAVAIPTTLALTLLIFYLYGFTLNRITLFALIFSIGILVDDAIVVVENIVRHFKLPESRHRDRLQVAIEAVNEVGNPTILATFAVIAAVLPMAFVGGLMGPYMRPIPIGSSAAMLFSLAVSFIVTPWTAIHILRRRRKNQEAAAGPEAPASGEGFFPALYRRIMHPLIQHASWRWGLLVMLALLLTGAMSLVAIGWVKVKMLPFDNKNEFQIILNMPEGSALEETARAAREIAAAVRREPEVTDYEIYVGVAAPFNFNGLVRHYFMRRGANVADLQINLVNKHDRQTKSHDLAKRVRPRVTAIAEKYGARVAVAEVPPGPPVLQTLVAEIYGPTEAARRKLARAVIDVFKQTEGVVDTDWYIEADQPKLRFVIDKAKAALHGISAETIAQTLNIAVSGASIGLVHFDQDREDVNLVLELPRSLRTSAEDLLALRLQSSNPAAPPALVPLRELVKVEHTTTDKSIYHKNMKPVTYVIGDVAGVIESPVYAILKMNRALRKLDLTEYGNQRPELDIYNYALPFTTQQLAMKWDGEWHITIEVFRDLGLAFAAVLILIYVLMVGWFRSFLTPLIVMTVIPFSLVGILPAHGALHAFFTATSMIGFMAGAGIVVRNSIILVDFIELRLADGLPLAEAVVDAGMVRFRPIMLTAMAVVVGGLVILFDPIFQGLAISLMAGGIIAMLMAPVMIPLLYYMANHRSSTPDRPRQPAGILTAAENASEKDAG